MVTKEDLVLQIDSLQEIIHDLRVQVGEAKSAFDMLRKHTADLEISKQKIQEEIYTLEEEVKRTENKNIELMRLVRHYETTINLLTGRLIEGSHPLYGVGN